MEARGPLVGEQEFTRTQPRCGMLALLDKREERPLAAKQKEEHCEPNARGSLV